MDAASPGRASPVGRGLRAHKDFVTVKPFKLSWPVGHSDSMDNDDVENTKKALTTLGLYEPPRLFTERFSNEPMVRGLKAFQTQHGLVPDGVMKPDGPTLKKLNEALKNEDSLTPLRKRELFEDSAIHPNLGEPPEPRTESKPATEITLNNEDGGSESVHSINETQAVEHQEEPSDTSFQIAAAPAVIPFGLWLMELLGAASIAAAMAIYNSWSKKRREEVKREYERTEEDRNDFCWQRYNDEFDRCRALPDHW